ncbi:MAG: hypothetical protein KBD31_00800 [Proteobacteria bacterium]|nr:hypothetical protein [Pseudomonadota bacterium]
MRFFNKILFLLAFLSFGLIAPGLTLTTAYSAELQGIKKVDAEFVKPPVKDKPLLILVLHGLGRTAENTQKWAEKKFPKKTKSGSSVIVKALDYEKVGLQTFEQKILHILGKIEQTKDNELKMKIVQEEEAKLLPELRLLIAANMDKITAEFDGIPLQNIIVVGYSLGGLIGSVLIEVIGNGKDGQVQSLLTSMAPPVGFINCAFGISDSKDEVTEKTLFPWIMHCEMGEKDPIFVNGALKMEHCFNVFHQLTENSKKHFTNDKHKGEHKTSKSFMSKVLKALEIASLRQLGKDAPISVQ